MLGLDKGDSAGDVIVEVMVMVMMGNAAALAASTPVP